jgi:phosphoribosylanthranilate isomerase
MPLLIKICGLKTPKALDVALEVGADQVGFVFFPPSPRNLGYEAARKLGQQVRGRAGKVALTVNATDDMLGEIIEALRPDSLQLHGTETPDRLVAIRTRFGLPVTKALPVAERADLSPIHIYAKVAEMLIFDARPPKEATRPGGLGKPFDWRLLENVDPGVPYLLSGGLDVGNVADALAITRAPGVDVSSGVERAPGEKDPDKIRAFVRVARAAATALASASPLRSGERSPARSAGG